MSNEKILIVDDDSAILQTCLKAVQSMAYDAKGVSSGEEAVEVLKEEHVDLVVTDLQMGGMSGIDLLKYIKANNPNTSVIIITAYPSADSAIESLRAGVSDYIKKPFNVFEFRDAVKRCLEARADLKEKHTESASSTANRPGAEYSAKNEVLTTYQVSRYCGVTLTTVTNWIEHGLIPAYKTPGGHRRVKKDDLIEFLKNYNMPIPDELK
ncbi:MAG: response regulator [Elusimicrobia bacterium]|nr:response regulator [Candidatus Liberimonas magnetica]